jgi:ParB/RepB/Spo0J family partition protein
MFRKNMEELKSIPLESIIYSRYLSRQLQINKNIEDLISNIKAVGLIQPILVFAIDDLQEGHDLYDSRKEFKGKYEILAGQRRYTAFQELNKQYPGEGFDKIPCHVRQPPDDELDAKAISIGENLTQLPMTMQDSINAVSALFDKHPDERVVSSKFGISIKMVRKYVKVARLPPLLKEHLGTLHKDPRIATNIALDANDALDYDPTDPKDVMRVVQFAKRLAEKKEKGQPEYIRTKEAAEHNPKKSVEEIEKISQTVKVPKLYKIALNAITSYALDSSAKENGHTSEEEGANIITDSLSSRISSSDSE